MWKWAGNPKEPVRELRRDRKKEWLIQKFRTCSRSRGCTHASARDPDSLEEPMGISWKARSCNFTLRRSSRERNDWLILIIKIIKVSIDKWIWSLGHFFSTGYLLISDDVFLVAEKSGEGCNHKGRHSHREEYYSEQERIFQQAQDAFIFLVIQNAIRSSFVELKEEIS